MLETLLLSYFMHQYAPAVAPSVPLIGTDAQLVVELSQPVIQSIPPGSTRVPLLTAEMKATCTRDIVVRGIDVQRRGMGSASDIEHIYATVDGFRVSRGRQLSRSGRATLSFRDLVIPACSSRTVTFYADFLQTASIAGEHWLTIVHGSSIDLEYGTATLRSLRSPAKTRTTGGFTQGKISVAYPRILKTIRYGSNRTVARVRLSADGKSDHLLYGMTFTNQGTAKHSDLTNLYLQTGRDRRVTTVTPWMKGDKIELKFSPPLRLERNHSKLFELIADVNVGRNRTWQPLIEQASDIHAVSVRGRR